MKIELIRSARKTLAIQIQRDGTVSVRAPYKVSTRTIEDFVHSHEDWIAEKVALAEKRARREAMASPEEEALLKKRATEILPEKTAYFAGRMGVQPAGVRITGARTRFGSCSSKNSICYSWHLMQYPEDAIDYVVVHELCHIRVKNHSPLFYAEVAKMLPDYKRRELLLKK